MKTNRYAQDKFPCLEKPILKRKDRELLIDYCSEMGYILDINDENGNAFIRDKNDKKVFIQKDYWGNIFVVKNRFTPQKEYENITENMKILQGVRSKVSKKFFESHFKAIFGILSFNPYFTRLSV